MVLSLSPDTIVSKAGGVIRSQCGCRVYNSVMSVKNRQYVQCGILKVRHDEWL